MNFAASKSWTLFAVLAMIVNCAKAEHLSIGHSIPNYYSARIVGIPTPLLGKYDHHSITVGMTGKALVCSLHSSQLPDVISERSGQLSVV